MAKIMMLAEAVAELVQDGDTIAMEGFTHLIPFAAGHEMIRQQKKDLYVIRMTPDIIYDQLIGAGAVRGMKFSWGGNPGVGSLHRFRDAVEQSWPRPIELEEHSHAAMANAYDAGASHVPFAVFRGYKGTDLPKVNSHIKFVTCPFSGEQLAAVPAIRPDVAIIHAQKSDRQGNILLEGIVGVQKEAVLAARRSIVTVEEIVEQLHAPSPNSVLLPGWAITAVAEVPGGAWPSYAQGYYERDNAFYIAWDAISRDRAAFLAWIEQNIMQKTSQDFAVHARLRHDDANRKQ